MTEQYDGYQGAVGGPRSPATPGGYCLLRCYCGTCPQYAEQVKATQELARYERLGQASRLKRRDAV